MTEPTPRPVLKILSNADVAALVESRGTARSVNMLHPMEIHVARDRVAALVRESLQLMQEGKFRSANETPEQKQAYMDAMQQRVDFLGWLQSQDELVYLAVYPADQDGLDEIELGDLADLPNADDSSPDGPLPF